MTLLFLALIISGSLLCLVSHPVWGIYTYVLVFYLDAPSRWWAAGLPDLRWSMLMVAITIVGTLIYKMRITDVDRRPSFFKQAPNILFSLYVAWMYLQYAWATSPDHSNGVIYFTKYLVVMYLIYILIDNRQRLIGFLIAHVIGCFYLALLAFSVVTGGRLDGVGGAGIDDANNLGIYMGTAAIAAGGLHFAIKGWAKWLPLVTMPFLLNTLVQTGSRGAFLALVCGFAGMYFYRPSKTTTAVLAYGIIGILLFGSLASEFFWDRVASIRDAAQQNEQADRSAVSRIYIVKDQWRMAVDHPFGVGHMGTTALSYQYIDPQYWSSKGGRSSHNTLMSTLVDQGFVGLLLWLTLNWKLYKNCRGIARWTRLEGDHELGWLVAILFGMFSVTWVGGLFAPFLKGEVFIWMVPLTCSLWTMSAGRATGSNLYIPK